MMPRIVIIYMVAFCCLVAGCAAKGGSGHDVRAHAQSSPVLRVGAAQAEAALYVEVTGETPVAEDLQSLLTALLQSEKGMTLASQPAAADYVIRVKLLQAGLTDSKVVGMALGDAAAPALMGTLGGVALGGAVGGRRGSAWGAGGGLLLGLSMAWAENSDNTSYTWAMLADVSIIRQQKGKPPKESASRVAATADGVNLNREDALPALEDALAREIVHAFQAEGS